MFLVSPDASQKRKRWTEEEPAAAAVTQDAKKILAVQETSRRGSGAAGPSSQEILTGEPIVPPYNGSVKLPVA